MASSVERFYDRFGARFVRDYVRSNRRVLRQLEFLRDAIPARSSRVLVLGCGSGESARFIAAEVAPGATVLGIDLSGENIQLATTLFAHPRVEYRKGDIVTDALGEAWDAIVLPDVYEHIPLAARPRLHAQLAGCLAGRGRILLTVPSPGKQAALAASGAGLQIVDEVVSVDDLARLATDVGGQLVYLSLISVWEDHDYLHAVVERGAEQVGPLSPDSRLPIHGGPRGLLARMRHGRPVALVEDALRGAYRYGRVRWHLRRRGR